LEQWAGNLLQGDQAFAASGVPQALWQGFREIARKNQALIATRPINPDASDLLNHGLGKGIKIATKGLSVKGKSADWGIQAGLIPFDSALSKVFGKDGLEHWSHIEKGNSQNVHSSRLPGMAAVQLQMDWSAIERRLAQGKLGSLTALEDGSYLATVTRAIESSDGRAGERPVLFQYRLTRQSNSLWSVEYKSEEYGIKRPEYKDFRPLKVMAEVNDDGSHRLFTADIDLFALFKRLDSSSADLGNSIREEAARIERLSANKGAGQFSSELARARWLSAYRRVTEGLGTRERRRFDPNKGTLTHFQESMIDQINEAAAKVGLPKVCHHGTEQDNIKYPERDDKILFIDPEGRVYQTDTFEQVSSILKYYDVVDGFLT
ncbi:CyaA/EF/ExoY family adenylyl cyclase toxin, partial [Endozoicomonas sp. SESOKO4]